MNEVERNAEAIRQTVEAMTQATVAMTQTAQALAAGMMSPKRIVRDPLTGKAIGVEVAQ